MLPPAMRRTTPSLYPPQSAMSSAIGVPIGRFDVLRGVDSPAGDGDDAGDERLARRAQALHGESRADVLAYVAELAGITAARHFLARQ